MQLSVVRSAHFEVYSHAGDRSAEATLTWLEQLRAFFIQAGVTKYGADLDSRGPVRVIAFESAAEYSRFRPEPNADAYFLSGEARDYLVLPQLSSQEFGVAAHEYAHLVLRSLDVHFPPWLAEGIAEFFSTVRIADNDCSIGGDLPARSVVLRQNSWIPLSMLLSETSPTQPDRHATDLFYAESWALTDMLIFSPAYAPYLTELFSAMASGASDPAFLVRIYEKPLNRIEADAHNWVRAARSAVPLPGVPTLKQHLQSTTMTDAQSQSILADLLLASGKLDDAQVAYQTLARQAPKDATVHAGLGNIALLKGQREMARQEWKLAMDLGIDDARLCYQYAILAEDAQLPIDEIRGALLRAVMLEPGFDDARYKLGLLENNSGAYEAAVQQLRSIHKVAPGRAYAYWTAMACALTELDQRQEAKNAAGQALRHASNADERASAERLAYFADTDLTVQVMHDANGNTRMMTARKPHGSDDWNPFVEPGDRMRSLQGQIRKVECNAGKITGFRVEGQSGSVEVAVTDPGHILIRGGNPEFVCGDGDGRQVVIDYAALDNRPGEDGVLRGMRFR